jgi:hypothetical protein
MNDNHERKERTDILDRLATGRAREGDLERILHLDAISRARSAWISATRG